MGDETVVSDFMLAAVLRDMASGATLCRSDDGLCVLVWPDGKAKLVNRYAANALEDCDYLQVIRSVKAGNEYAMNADGRRWLAHEEVLIAAAERAFWALYPLKCSAALDNLSLLPVQPAPGWLTQDVYDRLVGYDVDTQRVLDYMGTIDDGR